MGTTVVKFGGTSLASADQIRKAAAIARSHKNECFFVASAPGKRFSDDIKVTDLLYACYDEAKAGGDFRRTFDQIKERFDEIIRDLNLDLDLSDDYAKIEAHLATNPHRDMMASRGEYLNSKIVAAFLDFPFVDPAGAICFDADG